MSKEELVPVKTKTALINPITNINFATLQQRESISSTEFTTNQDENLLHFSPGPNKRYKQTVIDKQDEYDDSFASKGKSTTTSSYNFESEWLCTTNLHKAMTTVDEKGSKFVSVQELEENCFSLD